MVKKTIFLLFIFVLFQALLATSDGGNISSNQRYISGEDGNLLMYVNIWGHVKNPGTYLVYEGIDLVTLISLAGGPQSGANLNNIKIIHDSENNQITKINLDKYISDNKHSVSIRPHDTIYIKESMSSYIFSKTSLLNTILQIANMAFVASRL